MTTPTETRCSPGAWYNRHIKGQHAYLGRTEGPPLAGTVRVKAGSWIIGTWYAGKIAIDSAEVSGVLIIWRKDEKTGAVDGLAYLGVPSWKVGALHGFGQRSVAREYTADEMARLLRASLA